MKKPSIDVQLYALTHALNAQWITYQYWIKWYFTRNPVRKRLGLHAKTRGLIAYDRIMRAAYDEPKRS